MIGQHPTPDAVARLVYRLSGVRRGRRVMDPSCGDGVFVRCAPAGCAVFICERDERYRAALERLLPPQRLVLGDALTRLDHLWGTFDLAVGNPPFSAQSHLERRPEVLRQFDLGTGRKSQCLEVLFLELFLKLAKPGGRIAIILPDGPLANRPFHYVRRWLLERARVETIVSLPRGVFANTTAKTNILIAKKYGTIQTTEYTEHTEGGIVDASRVTQMGVAVLPCVPVRQASLAALVNCKVLIMVNGRKPCSRVGGGWKQFRPSKPDLINARAVVSRELESASLHETESGQPVGYGEARISPQVSTSAGWTLRGERRRRVRIESPGTWEARPGARREPPRMGSHNRAWVRVAASERPVVARKPGNAGGAKGPWPRSSRVRGTWS
jgi:predicted RNA methylase